MKKKRAYCESFIQNSCNNDVMNDANNTTERDDYIQKIIIYFLKITDSVEYPK